MQPETTFNECIGVNSQLNRLNESVICWMNVSNRPIKELFYVAQKTVVKHKKLCPTTSGKFIELSCGELLSTYWFISQF